MIEFFHPENEQERNQEISIDDLQEMIDSFDSSREIHAANAKSLQELVAAHTAMLEAMNKATARIKQEIEKRKSQNQQ